MPELAAAQREVLEWSRIWPLEPARPLLQLRARQLSDRMLELSGLVPGASGTSTPPDHAAASE